MLKALDGVGELLPSSVPRELYAAAFYADVEYMLIFDALAISATDTLTAISGTLMVATWAFRGGLLKAGENARRPTVYPP